MDMGSGGVYTLFTLDGGLVAGTMKIPDERPQQAMWLSYVVVDDADATAAQNQGTWGRP